MNLYSKVVKLFLLVSSQVVATSNAGGDFRGSAFSITNIGRAVDDKECKDSKKFVIKKNGKKNKKKCSWVEDKPKRRCNVGNAMKKCKVTCKTCPKESSPNTESSSPTNSPTSSPSNSPIALTIKPNWCKDSKITFQITTVNVTKKEPTCSWAKRRNNCDIAEVRYNCPVLCNNCNCLDNQKKFQSSKSTRTCNFVGKNQNRCKRPNVEKNCPLSCGKCPNQPKTDQPTKGPSKNL